MRAVLLALAALATGCLDLEVARFARVRAAQAAGAAPAALVPGVGRSCVTIVGVFPVTPLPSLGDAIAGATAGATLRDAVVRYELRYLPFVGGRGCYVVEGDVR